MDNDTASKILKILNAVHFAVRLHDDQNRKYTNEPYVLHPLEVAMMVLSVSEDIDMVLAAILHDVVEDTECTISDIQKHFGPFVARYVSDLTDISKPSDGNRAARKRIDLEHTAKACADAKTIKLADLINNTESIVDRDPEFAKTYMMEKKALLEVLKEGNEVLYFEASELVDDYFNKA